MSLVQSNANIIKSEHLGSVAQVARETRDLSSDEDASPTTGRDLTIHEVESPTAAKVFLNDNEVKNLFKKSRNKDPLKGFLSLVCPAINLNNNPVYDLNQDSRDLFKNILHGTQINERGLTESEKINLLATLFYDYHGASEIDQVINPYFSWIKRAENFNRFLEKLSIGKLPCEKIADFSNVPTSESTLVSSIKEVCKKNTHLGKFVYSSESARTQVCKKLALGQFQEGDKLESPLNSIRKYINHVSQNTPTQAPIETPVIRGLVSAIFDNRTEPKFQQNFGYLMKRDNLFRFIQALKFGIKFMGKDVPQSSSGNSENLDGKENPDDNSPLPQALLRPKILNADFSNELIDNYYQMLDQGSTSLVVSNILRRMGIPQPMKAPEPNPGELNKLIEKGYDDPKTDLAEIIALIKAAVNKAKDTKDPLRRAANFRMVLQAIAGNRPCTPLKFTESTTDHLPGKLKQYKPLNPDKAVPEKKVVDSLQDPIKEALAELDSTTACSKFCQSLKIQCENGLSSGAWIDLNKMLQELYNKDFRAENFAKNFLGQNSVALFIKTLFYNIWVKPSDNPIRKYVESNPSKQLYRNLEVLRDHCEIKLAEPAA